MGVLPKFNKNELITERGHEEVFKLCIIGRIKTLWTKSQYKDFTKISCIEIK